MLDPKTGVANFATKFEFPPKDETEEGYMRLQGMSGNATMLVDGWKGFCSKVKLLLTAVHGGFPGN